MKATFICFILNKSVLWVSPNSLALWRLRFHVRGIHVGFVLDSVELGTRFSQNIWGSPFILISSVVHVFH